MRNNLFSTLLIFVIIPFFVIFCSFDSFAQKTKIDTLHKSVNPTNNLSSPTINERKSVNPTVSSELAGELQSVPKGSAPPSEKAECEGELPSITFPESKSVNPTQPKSVNPTQPRSNAAQLQPNAIKILQSVAAQLKERPDCKLKVEGHASGDKMSQQLSWDRVNAIIRYLVEKTGISEKRFIFEYGTEGDPNTVDLMFTSEEGPTSVPQPHPQFRTNGH